MSKKYGKVPATENGHFAVRNSRTGQFIEKRGGEPMPPTEKRGFLIRDSGSGQFTIGSAGMSKLNAIEGITQSGDSRKMFADFERRGASAEDRRREIVAKHARKG
jgi:hypothetical protein